jgi:replicative DNA helicase
MLKNLSNKEVHTGLFALEMHSMAVVTKLLSYVSGVAIKTITKNYLKMSDLEKSILDSEMGRLSGNNYLHVNDKPQSLRNIEEQAMVLQDLLGTNYIPIAIDLFGKIKDVRSSKNVAQDYESSLNYVQEMAKRLDLPIILVAQISREVTKRKFNRPTMADLKNSNAFAEVSDLMLGVHRPYYDPEKALKEEIDKGCNSIRYGDEDETDDYMVSDPLKNLVEVIIMKQRMGPGNKIVRMYFDPNTTCCTPIPQEYQHLFSAVGLDDDGF